MLIRNFLIYYCYINLHYCIFFYILSSPVVDSFFSLSFFHFSDLSHFLCPFGGGPPTSRLAQQFVGRGYLKYVIMQT